MSTALALPPATSQSDTIDFIPALQLANDALIGVLESSVYPGAKRESIALVIDYCRAARLDPLQQPVHILPIQVESDKLDSKGFPIMVRRDVIRPGIGLYRTQASRTEQHDSTSQPEFGPEREITFRERVTEWENGQKTTRWVEATLTYPEWCLVTVKRRRPDGHVSVFVGFEYWLENYATKGDGFTPNAMWRKRPRAQLAKCAEAQALRRGFPGIANAPTADETEGHPLLIERDEDEPQGTPEPAKFGAPQRRSSKAAQAASEATPPPPPAPPPPPPPPPPPAPPAATSEPAADRDPFGEDPAPPAAAPASEPAAAPPAHDPGPGDQRPEPPPQTPREPAQASPNGNKPASAAWLRTLRVRIQAANWTEAAILKQFDLEQLDGISTARATEIAGWVQANARNPG